MFYVYMLRCDDNSLYTGYTTDISKRFDVHQSKDAPAAKYTKSHTVVSLEAFWEVDTKSLALRLEARIKKLTKAKKEELISNPDTISIYINELLTPLN